MFRYLPIVFANLSRRKTRTILTLLSVIASFLLFGLLDSVRVAFNSAGSVAGADRLVVSSRLSITQLLPLRLFSEIQTVSGVKRVAFAAWFGGNYQDPRNFFPNFSVSEGYLDLYPEFELSPEQRRAWEDDRTGAIVGESLAKRFGWKIGDTIPLEATLFPQRNGSNAWPMTLRGIYTINDSRRKGEENQLLFHWSYFNESNAYVRDRVGWYMVQMQNVDDATRVAGAIDGLSVNSAYETKTQTEQAFNQAFANQFANVGLIVTLIVGAVFFTLLLVSANTMVQAVRERTPELAVLKAVGFRDGSLLALVMAESTLLVVMGGVAGMLLASLLIPGISAASGGIVALDSAPAETWLLGLALMIGIGAIVGFQPAMKAMRLKIVDALAGR